MSRTILYYPTIDVPTTGNWIRGALLYWDQIASIVPTSYDGRYAPSQKFSKDIQCLADEGIFRAVNPNRLLDGPHNFFQPFLQEFNDIIKSKPFRATVASRKERRLTDRIYRDKLAHETFWRLREMGLAEERNHTEEDQYVYYFDPIAAQVYMALLAEYLSYVEGATTIPGTDRTAAMTLAFRARKGSGAQICLSATFSEILPLPTRDASIRDILKFRRDHRAELLALRAEIDDSEKKLRACKTEREMKAVAVRFKERVERESLNLSKALHASKLSSIWGSLQSFFEPNAPVIVGGAAVITNQAVLGAPLPINWLVGGAAIVGAIRVRMHLVKERRERDAALQKSPFAYLFLARKRFSKTR